MAGRDPHLPTLPSNALTGAFAKTHMMTTLPLYKHGRLPDLERVVSSQPEALTRELREALSHPAGCTWAWSGEISHDGL